MLIPTPIHSHPLTLIFNPLPLMFSPFLLILNPPPPMCSLSHPFPVHIQIVSPNPIYHLPFQPKFSPCVLHAYLFYVPVRLCAFVFHVPMCLCLCTLRAFVCVNVSGLFIYTAFLQTLAMPVFFSWCLFSSYGFSAHIFQCFRLFDVVRAQTYLGSKKRIFTKFHWFFF